jgi:hypothetical protein
MAYEMHNYKAYVFGSDVIIIGIPVQKRDCVYYLGGHTYTAIPDKVSYQGTDYDFLEAVKDVAFYVPSTIMATESGPVLIKKDFSGVTYHLVSVSGSLRTYAFRSPNTPPPLPQSSTPDKIIPPLLPIPDGVDLRDKFPKLPGRNSNKFGIGSP